MAHAGSLGISVEDVEIQWFGSRFLEAVYINQDGTEQVREQRESGAGEGLGVCRKCSVRIQSPSLSNGMNVQFFKRP